MPQDFDVLNIDPCYLYVFAKETDGGDGRSAPVKVGISANVSDRLRNIQTACPFKVGAVWTFHTPNRAVAAELERAFHEIHAPDREFGEWFDVHPIHAVHALCIYYRGMLDMTLSDPSIKDTILELAKVIEAEKAYGLAAPKSKLARH